METRTLGPRGFKVGVIGLGTMSLGGHYAGELDDDHAHRLLNEAVDRGINLIDTADVYGFPQGLSEERIGAALRHRRGEIILATKVGNWARPLGHPLPYTDPSHIELCCDASLHRLRTDVIDIYQCHLHRLTEPDVFLEAFDRLIERGKIRCFGISANSLPVIRGFNRDNRCAVCQLDYSILHRAPEREVLDYCQQHGIGTLIRGALDKGIATGKFTAQTRFTDPDRMAWNEPGKLRELLLRKLEVVEQLRPLAGPNRSLAQLALRFVLAHPAVSCTIPGASTVDQVTHNADAGDLALSDAELNRIRDLTEPAITWG